jgi:hypothetical protein
MAGADGADGPGPVRVSADGRYFVDAAGAPFFWLGDTQWELARRFSLDEVGLILESRRRQGFSVLQVMLTGLGDGTGPNLAGRTPWLDHDPLTPDEGYFAHVDAVLDLCRSSGLVVALGVYHQLQEERITLARAREYAAWVAHRYRDVPNLIWSTYPRAEPEQVAVVRELAAGLRQGDGGGPISSRCTPIRPRPPRASGPRGPGPPSTRSRPGRAPTSSCPWWPTTTLSSRRDQW